MLKENYGPHQLMFTPEPAPEVTSDDRLWVVLCLLFTPIVSSHHSVHGRQKESRVHQISQHSGLDPWNR